jgi:hypothetical protein
VERVSQSATLTRPGPVGQHMIPVLRTERLPGRGRDARPARLLETG